MHRTATPHPSIVSVKCLVAHHWSLPTVLCVQECDTARQQARRPAASKRDDRQPMAAGSGACITARSKLAARGNARCAPFCEHSVLRQLVAHAKGANGLHQRKAGAPPNCKLGVPHFQPRQRSSKATSNDLVRRRTAIHHVQ